MHDAADFNLTPSFTQLSLLRGRADSICNTVSKSSYGGCIRYKTGETWACMAMVVHGDVLQLLNNDVQQHWLKAHRAALRLHPAARAMSFWECKHHYIDWVPDSRQAASRIATSVGIPFMDASQAQKAASVHHELVVSCQVTSRSLLHHFDGVMGVGDEVTSTSGQGALNLNALTHDLCITSRRHRAFNGSMSLHTAAARTLNLVV